MNNKKAKHLRKAVQYRAAELDTDYDFDVQSYATKDMFGGTLVHITSVATLKPEHPRKIYQQLKESK